MNKYLRSEINKKLEKEAWRGFLSDFKKMPHGYLEKFFNQFLSPEEKLILARRLTIVLLIKQGRNYREISQILGVSPQTISAAKKSFLKNANYLTSRFYKEKKSKELLKNVHRVPEDSFFDYLARTFSKAPDYRYTGRKGKGRWRFSV